MTDPSDILALIQERHGMSWTLVGRLAGGYQQGAYELRDKTGQRAVLKWHRSHLPKERLTDVAGVLSDARARGWPTSEWLAFGSLPDDGAYVVEELIEGTRPSSLDGIFEPLMRAVALQRDVRPRTEQDWSSYIWRVVFDNEDDLAARMRQRADTGELLRRIEALTADARAMRLPSNDLVHGDFVLGNMVVRNGSPYLIDAAHAGRGTRAYDLATLLMETSVGGDYTPPSREQRRRLTEECIAIAGRVGFNLCFACRMMLLIAFGGDTWDWDVPGLVAKCHAFLDGLAF